MQNESFHEKSLAKAKELAERLGVKFTPPDMKAVEEKAKTRLELLAKYHKNKEQYDSVMNKLLDLLPAKDIQSIIQKLLGTKTK